MVDNQVFMKRALMLARRGRTSPNPMVGAVVVRDGQIVGEGFHPEAGKPHAEVYALRAAGGSARGADLYVTLEPCCHYGRTPPCTDAIIESGVRRVFAAMYDPDSRVSGEGVDILRRSGIEVDVGMLESEARRLNEGYIKRTTTGLPFVLWKTAMTLDGKIACESGDSCWITGERARKEVHRLRSRFDAVMTGAGTVLADDPELTVRGVRGAINPTRVIVDSSASIPLDARVLNSSAPTIVAVTERAPAGRIEEIRGAGVTVLVLPEKNSMVDIRALMIVLASMGVNSVLLECGGGLAASMLAEGLIDKGIAFIAPKIIGGRGAKTPVEGAGIELMSQAQEVSITRVRRVGEDVAFEFSIRR